MIQTSCMPNWFVGNIEKFPSGWLIASFFILSRISIISFISKRFEENDSRMIKKYLFSRWDYSLKSIICSFEKNHLNGPAGTPYWGETHSEPFLKKSDTIFGEVSEDQEQNSSTQAWTQRIHRVFQTETLRKESFLFWSLMKLVQLEHIVVVKYLKSKKQRARKGWILKEERCDNWEIQELRKWRSCFSQLITCKTIINIVEKSTWLTPHIWEENWSWISNSRNFKITVPPKPTYNKSKKYK